MKGNQKVLDALNAARAAELTAILQYMAHHYELEDQDFGKLAKVLKQTAIVEMKHAEKLAERILFLEGTPTYQPDGEVKKGQRFEELLASDRALEEKAVKMYQGFSSLAAEAGDQVTKELFDSLLAQEEDHWNTFDNVLTHVQDIGAPYVARLAGEEAD